MLQPVTGFRRIATVAAAAAFGALVLMSTGARSQQPSGPSPTKVAVENRKAALSLIGNYFRYFGALARGTATYDEAEATKRAARIAFLSGLLEENFPPGSNVGEPDSKAKPEIWNDRADFDKKLKDFQTHAQAFVEVNAKEKGATEGLKAGIASLAQDCKGCHDTYKAK